MFSETAYERTLVVYVIAAVATFAALWFISAPYGRHKRKGFGPEMNAALAWGIMEGVALITMPVVSFVAVQDLSIAMIVLIALWTVHYANRAIIYPLSRRRDDKSLPILIPLLAICFNVLNGYANGLGLAHAAARYDASWLSDPRFIVGVGLFLIGAYINISSDRVLLQLRRDKGPGYHIPNKGLHKQVAAPNYLGEILEWTGWAIAAWTPAGFLFAAYTFANLAPRAHSHLKWYRATFTEYPKNRKALAPFLW
ncbi:MAG: DUF1295 domain-containing protein [Pseudomonadota bacterium]